MLVTKKNSFKVWKQEVPTTFGQKPFGRQTFSQPIWSHIDQIDDRPNSCLDQTASRPNVCRPNVFLTKWRGTSQTTQVLDEI
jgi:hypothetical protein